MSASLSATRKLSLIKTALLLYFVLCLENPLQFQKIWSVPVVNGKTATKQHRNKTLHAETETNIYEQTSSRQLRPGKLANICRDISTSGVHHCSVGHVLRSTSFVPLHADIFTHAVISAAVPVSGEDAW